jgi:pSer/pThr/pTyr-binding forkhead associated (FHA) protein
MTRDSRGVPPTPPSGLPRVDLPAPAPTSERSAADEADGIAARQKRPEAPAWSFGPPSDPQASKKAVGECPVCQSENPINYRFCACCGGKLQAGPPAGQAGSFPPQLGDAPPPSGRKLPRPPRPAGAAPESIGSDPRSSEEMATIALQAIDAAGAGGMGASAQNLGDTKIVGAPVVDIASTAPKPDATHPCWRCSGINTVGARFCKYCGAPLEKGVVSERPAWSPPAEPTSDLPPPMQSPAASTGSHAAIPPAAIPPAAIPRAAPPPRLVSGGSPGAPPSQRATVEGAAPPSLAPATVPRQTPLRASAPPSAPPRPIANSAAAAPARSVTAAEHSAGRLVVIVEDGSEGRSFPLTGQQVDIGRSEGDILLYHDQYVSPRHARLVWVDDHWRLRDLGSVNHVYVRIRRPTPLCDGDLLLLGLEVLQFQTVSDAERGLGPATQHGTLLFGSPASPRRARLNQRTVEGVTRDVFHLFRDETVIGREVGDIVFTADPFLSRRHAAIRKVGGGQPESFALVDLDSSNGTYVAIREDVTLEHGDFVRIGQHLFRLDFSTAAPAKGRGPKV